MEVGGQVIIITHQAHRVQAQAQRNISLEAEVVKARSEREVTKRQKEANVGVRKSWHRSEAI